MNKLYQEAPGTALPHTADAKVKILNESHLGCLKIKMKEKWKNTTIETVNQTPQFGVCKR